MEEGPPTGKPVNIEISGDDFEVLGELAAQVLEKIRNVEGLVDIADNYDQDLPELRVIPDVDKAVWSGDTETKSVRVPAASTKRSK